MNEAEKILEKFARKNMIQWNQESFKRTHSRLHKSIIEAINEALNLHSVVGQSEQLPCDCSKHATYFDEEQEPRCKNCNKKSWLAR